MNIKLIKPSSNYKDSIINYWNEFKSNGESLFDDDKSISINESFENWLSRISNESNPKTVSKDWVLTDTFLAVTENNKIIGMCELRYSTLDIIKDFGQVGYDVRPSERKNGYATEIVRLLAIQAKNSGMNELYISVEETNIASIKVIKNNNGKFVKNFSMDNEIVNVYKINLL